jgi:hypothetical protein
VQAYFTRGDIPGRFDSVATWNSQYWSQFDLTAS